MKILCLMKQAPAETIRTILEIQKREHTVTIVNINEDRDYDRIVDVIASSDSVVCW